MTGAVAVSSSHFSLGGTLCSPLRWLPCSVVRHSGPQGELTLTAVKQSLGSATTNGTRLAVQDAGVTGILRALSATLFHSAASSRCRPTTVFERGAVVR